VIGMLVDAALGVVDLGLAVVDVVTRPLLEPLWDYAAARLVPPA
jgi:hypothetical protein